ncbi:MAG: MFS transporter [Actinomycetota bacterium]
MTAAQPAAEQPGFFALLNRPELGRPIIIQIVVMMGFGMALPILPLYARSLGASIAAAGLFASMFGLVRLAMDLGGGPLVDRFGERLIAPAGLAIYGVGTLVAGLAPTLPAAIFSWALGGAGSALFFAAQFSYVIKASPKELMARVLSVFYASFNAGLIAGGVLTGVIINFWGIAGPLRVYAVLLLGAAVLYRRVVPPVERRAEQEAEAREDIGAPQTKRFNGLLELFKTRGFFMVMLVQFSYMFMVTAIFDTLLPLFAKESLEMSEAGVGFLFGIAIAAELTVLYPTGLAADRHGRRIVMIPGLIALIITTSWLGLATVPAVLFVLVAFLGVASGIAGVPPGAMLADISPEGRSGTMVGAFRFVGDLAFFIGPLIAGSLAEVLGFRAAFLACSVPLALALAAVIRTPETSTLRGDKEASPMPALP